MVQYDALCLARGRGDGRGPGYARGARRRRQTTITETDLYAFQWIADPRISPDGAQIVYTRVVVNARHDGYESALWLIPAAGAAGGRTARQITRRAARHQSALVAGRPAHRVPALDRDAR